MEPHIKIVDLFGLPGCGKTTLENELLKCESEEGLRFCKMTEVSQQYRKEKLFRKVYFFPYRLCFLLTLFFLMLPKLEKHNWRIYKGAYLLSIIYAYCHFINSDKIMLVDHGIIQSVSSLMYNRVDKLTSVQSTLLARIIRTIDIDFCVYCQVSPDISLLRIRQRNRQNSGRLDSIESDQNLLTDLGALEMIFKTIAPESSRCMSISTEGSIRDVKNTFLRELKTRI